ncbi:P-type conjugative transfer protein TrbL [Phenylobacterium sp. LjRoot164]|uniref:P-type conjugative transfer protein TrbL n=1 Tax=unclassified Phenylobacterium TaxID=2640670 RepID=UPI003ECE626F
MATASPAALDEFLARFSEQIGTGFGLIQGDVQTVFALLVVISLALSALFWALDESRNVPAALIRKVMLFGVFAWVITGWRALSQTVANGFVALGLKAGGGALSTNDILEAPSMVVADGLNVAFALVEYIGRLSKEALGAGFFANFDAILIAGIAVVGIIIAFVILAVEIAITIIEFHLVTLIALVVVPFGILTQTAFLSERSIGYVFSVGLKLMALALIISIGEQIFTTYTVSPDPSWEECCGLLLAAVVMVMLALKIPSVAAALVSGGPQLSAGSAVAGAAAVAAGVGGLALAGRLGGLVGAGSGSKAADAMAASNPPRTRGGTGAPAGGAPPSPGAGHDTVTAYRRAPVATIAAKARASFTRRPPDDPAPAPPPPPPKPDTAG